MDDDNGFYDDEEEVYPIEDVESEQIQGDNFGEDLGGQRDLVDRLPASKKRTKVDQSVVLAANLVQVRTIPFDNSFHYCNLKASRTGNFEELKSLIEQGAKVNEKICGCTALM
jgi:hypothetical protein